MKNFEEASIESINIIREWEALTFIQKLMREKPRPSGIDYRLAHSWISENTSPRQRAKRALKRLRMRN